MALRNMTGDLMGWVSNLDIALATTLVNEALQKIYDESTWSFQLGEAGWLSPNLMSLGTTTTTQFSNLVVGDATATAAWLAMVGRPFITEQQFRCPTYSLYNIVAYDDGTDPVNSLNYPFATLLLDRPWMEPAGPHMPYMIYQAYYPAPVPDFKRFLTVRDFTNASNLDFWSKKESDLAVLDPQRTVFQNAVYVVPYEVDQRGAGTDNASSTVGSMMFELYPHPLAQLPYTLYFVRSGQLLSAPSDTIPYPLTEDLVKSRARIVAYQWKEAQKTDGVQRGSGANFKFLMESAAVEYADHLQKIRKRDRDLCDNFITKLRRYNQTIGAPYYSAITGQANVGMF